jgi:tyrosyl-tRNA synthetase
VFINIEARFGGMHRVGADAIASKMSASDPNSKIDLLDKPEVVTSKLKKAVCAPNEIEGNGVLSFVEFVLFPISELSGKCAFHVPRPDKYGGPLDYSSFEDLKKDYAEGTVCNLDIAISTY